MFPPGVLLMISGAIGYALAKRRNDELRGCMMWISGFFAIAGIVIAIIGLVQQATA